MECPIQSKNPDLSVGLFGVTFLTTLVRCASVKGHFIGHARSSNVYPR